MKFVKPTQLRCVWLLNKGKKLKNKPFVRKNSIAKFFKKYSKLGREKQNVKKQ